MRRYVIPLALAAIVSATSVRAQTELEKGFAGALKGCEAWVLDPASWAEGTGPFIAAAGLGNQMGRVASIDESQQPPRELRAGNIYWRINSTETAGYMLVVSHRLPICHITGGGDTDLQPVIESFLAADAFTSRWERIAHDTKGDMVTSVFRNREEPAFSVVISRAKAAGQRLDRVQVMATATYKLSR